VILAEQVQPVLQAALIQALSTLGLEAYLLWITTSRRLNPYLNKGVCIAGQALDDLE
jgi:hypothetical protein